jgi:hypothetical protein
MSILLRRNVDWTDHGKQCCEDGSCIERRSQVTNDFESDDIMFRPSEWGLAAVEDDVMGNNYHWLSLITITARCNLVVPLGNLLPGHHTLHLTSCGWIHIAYSFLAHTRHIQSPVSKINCWWLRWNRWRINGCISYMSLVLPVNLIAECSRTECNGFGDK